MPGTRPLGAQISHMLKNRGVDVIFGIPGVHNQELYRGIEEAGITHVLARHEQGAGFMADGYARATGRPGVAYVITGPGLTNIMTPMGQAYSDSVPLLVISSCLDETAATQGQLHQMKDQRAAAETVCDWSQEARNADAAFGLIDRALTEFETKRRRPKHVQIPNALLQEPAPNATDPGFAPSCIAADTSDCNDLRDALDQAERPLFVLGGGVQQDVTALMSDLGAAVFTSYAGRGCVAAEYPLLFGSYLARPDSGQIIATADLLVVAGCELAEVDLWRKTLAETDAPMYRIDIDPTVLSDHHRADWTILGDWQDVVKNLQLAPITAANGWSQQEISTARARWRNDVEAERPGIVTICDALRKSVPDDTMIYSDMTQFAYVAKEIWDMDRPGHWHHPTGFGTLGYATPAAIGGAVARPGQPTLAIIGDYGFHYTMAELGVAVELGLPLPIILWDNGKLKEIDDSMTRAQIAPNAVVARNPDFCALAQAFGAHTAAPQTLSDMQNVVQAAFSKNSPTLIYLTPALSSSSD